MQTDLEFEIINFESPDFEVMPISIDGRPPEWKSVLLAKNKINHLIPFCCREFQGEAAANSSPKRLKMNRFKPPSILLQIHACCQEKLQLDEKQASRRPIGQAFIPTTNTFDSADV
jgi:hypothetical protein